MEISFFGYPITQNQKAMIVHATSLALDSLVTSRMKNSLIIDIRIQKDMFKKHSVWGDMMNEDHDERYPKHFEIRINYSGKQSFATLIKVLCHELIHVTQFASRRLRYLSGPYRVAFLKDHYSSDSVEYDDRPWEIEAHELEDEVFEYVKANYEEIEIYFQKTKGYTWEPALDQSMVRN
jgi:hypothetical protein